MKYAHAVQAYVQCRENVRRFQTSTILRSRADAMFPLGNANTRPNEKKMEKKRSLI